MGKDITLTFRGGEKVGVVGRTGSGKSSLMNLLFRITEAEKDGGRILIDGIDTVEIGTSILRTKLSIIPQDPVMFSNTVRYNLDPFGDKSDVELWEVLKKVQLDEIIAALPLGLEDQVAEGGENYSQGQRQLLCIARSLLRNPKILVMDEATASIDNKTDADIQRMIRENFADATVLTILIGWVQLWTATGCLFWTMVGLLNLTHQLRFFPRQMAFLRQWWTRATTPALSSFTKTGT